MRLHPILLVYLGRRAVVPTLVGAAALAGYMLWPTDPLTGREGIPALIVIVAAVWLAIALGRLDKGEMGFLYTRGFRWDAIWWHRVLVGSIATAVVGIAGFAVIRLGLRTGMQMALGNSLYPLVARRETWAPMYWLGLYALTLCTASYVVVRAESRFPLAGLWLAIAVLLSAILGAQIPPEPIGWLRPLLLGLGICVIAALLWASRSLHRAAEVL